MRRITSRNSPDAFVRRRAKLPASWASHEPAVTIKQNEKNIVERGFLEGWIHPDPPKHRSGKKVAIVGSGPAGLAAAQQLCRAGHAVTVYEKADRIGGLLRYGIPEFKLEKHIIDRRLEQMTAEGVKFVTNAHVGVNIAVEDLRRDFDAIVLAGGSEQPRDLKIPGRELKGIHFAMEFLPQQNKRCHGDTLDACDRDSCYGQARCDHRRRRHRSRLPWHVSSAEAAFRPSVRDHAKAAQERSPQTPWPLWPMQLRTEGAHEEGGIRDWSIATSSFTGDESGNVKQLHAVRVGAASEVRADRWHRVHDRC